MKNLLSQVRNSQRFNLLALFFPFMYAQLVLLRAGNAAGRGYLSDARQELVYGFLQAAVILGFLLHAGFRPRPASGRARDAVSLCALGLCAAGGLTLLFLSPASLFCLIVTGVTVFLLGWVGGAVYLRLSVLFRSAKHAGLQLGGAYAAAVALQFVTQLRWNVLPAVAVCLLSAFACLAVCLTGSSLPETAAPGPAKPPVSRSRLFSVTAITAALLLFTVYYTGYIHHLQIASGYGAYNVYSWPRLLMIPVVLLFGRLGEIRDGRLLPVGTLCVALAAFLNTVLAGRETYLLNMCLYYVALAGAVTYYHVVFLRLAPQTKRPALWACMGRLTDSAVVVFSLTCRFSRLPQAAVLAVDVSLLALVIVLMAYSGDLSPKPSAPPAPPPALPVRADPFPILQARFGITPAEMNVLRELVLTEDKQEVIAARLNISVSTMRHHITSIYRKTDVQSRAGLCKLAVSCET